SFSQATFAGISASAPGVSTAANAINTVTFWMLYKGSGTSTALALGSGTGIGINTGYLGFTGGAESYGISSSSYNNQWVFVAAQIQNGVAASSANDILYINGAKQSSLGGGSAPTMTATQSVYIGSNGVAQTFNGLLANVQIYNYSLSGNEIVALYDSGIGADPQAITNIAGWWQLNGNANDYSGNLNNGVATNVVYTSSWTAGYTAP
ncbi:MAG TPA: LamG-like jellyroll fold domain-containing protein, partial [Candidatus Saccharimonadales bacterium]|nr:LamG-like jellyroll fold domain-containing protein [Candidatus Saccharimonadales bacterium]